MVRVHTAPSGSLIADNRGLRADSVLAKDTRMATNSASSGHLPINRYKTGTTFGSRWTSPGAGGFVLCGEGSVSVGRGGRPRRPIIVARDRTQSSHRLSKTHYVACICRRLALISQGRADATPRLRPLYISVLQRRDRATESKKFLVELRSTMPSSPGFDISEALSREYSCGH